MAYLSVVKVQDALEDMKKRIFIDGNRSETVDLHLALGRYLAEDLFAKENLPAFRRSMVDGYALRFEDTIGASEQSPIVFKITGKVDMGESTALQVKPGDAVYVPTGGILPSGANAMVMVEHTEHFGPDIAVFSTVSYNENIVNIGDDVPVDQLILAKGTRIASHHMGICASLGFANVPAFFKTKVAILTTGDELVEISSFPQQGQVRDCNLVIIKSIVEEAGCEVVLAMKISDQLKALQMALVKALECADIVLLSGGSSAGNKDLTQRAIDLIPSESSEPNVFIHGLAIKPGKPTIIANVNNKAVIGLPGHPAASFITMKALVEPFIKNHFFSDLSSERSIPCVSTFQIYASSGRDVYHFVELVNENGVMKANLLQGKSGMVSAMAKANAYVVIPMHNEGIKVGDVLTAYLL